MVKSKIKSLYILDARVYTSAEEKIKRETKGNLTQKTLASVANTRRW